MGGKGMRKTILLVLVCVISGCGTFNLGNVHPQTGKTAEQQQLDTLTCKDQANLAANTAARQTGDFLLGLTIVGTPFAIEREKAKEREVFAACLQARGYVVSPADGTTPTATATAATSEAPTPPVLGADKLALALPGGFAMKPLTDTMKNQGAVFFALNRTLDLGVMVSPVRHDGITDLTAFAQTKRANQADRLKEATFTEVTRLEVGGHNAVRYSATGTYNNVKITYVTTLIEGHDLIVIVNAWAGATNAQQHMPVLEGLADAVSGIP
jgi:hypothetical protein